MHTATQFFLVGTSIANFITFLFFAVLLAGLVKTRIKSGNTITSSMIIERLALVLIFLWNTLIAIGATDFVYYDGWIRLISVGFRFFIGVALVVSILFILTKE